MARDSHGALFTWGLNRHGQLGLGEPSLGDGDTARAAPAPAPASASASASADSQGSHDAAGYDDDALESVLSPRTLFSV